MPETGTVNYYYNANGTLAYKIDAKNQKISYDYDGVGRVTRVHHYPSAGGAEDSSQLVQIYWDTNPWVSFFGDSGQSSGRVAVVSYNLPNFGQVMEKYVWDQTAITSKWFGNLFNTGTRLVANFTYNDQGQLITVQYPNSGPTYHYTYDSMGRLNGMTDQNNS